MSYSPIVNYAAKDALAHLDPNKAVKGVDLSAEFVAIAADLLLKATAADLATANATLANVVGGTYTPTITNTTNVDSSSAALSFYMRIGSVVFVLASIMVNITSSGPAEVGISLPVASNLGAATDLIGFSGGVGLDTGDDNVGIITGDTANDRAKFNYGASSGSGNQQHRVIFAYRII